MNTTEHEWTPESVSRAVEDSSRFSQEDKDRIRHMFKDGSIESILKTAVSLNDLIDGLSTYLHTNNTLTPSPSTTTTTEGGLDKLQNALKILYVPSQSSKKTDAAKDSIKQMIKILKLLTNDKPDKKSLRMLTKNIVFTKYIQDVQGAEDFLHAIGYNRMIEKKKEYFTITAESIDQGLIKRAIVLLNQLSEQIDLDEKEPVDVGPRVECAGGCGFFGDRKQENLCSQCYKKKYDNTSTATTSSSSTTVEEKVPEAAPVLCIAKCGFFGSPKFRGMCSVCYKKNPNFGRSAKARWRSVYVKLNSLYRLRKGIRAQQTNTKICWHCRKKIGYEGIQCKCRYIFCGKHRYPDEHDCPYDHRKLQRKRLETQLQRVAADKFERITTDHSNP